MPDLLEGKIRIFLRKWQVDGVQFEKYSHCYDAMLKQSPPKAPNPVIFLNKSAENKLDMPALLRADNLKIDFIFGAKEIINRRV